MNKTEAKKRLEELRVEIRKERISTGEIAELQGLVEYIEDGDVELLEWAGVPEFEEGKNTCDKCGVSQDSEELVWLTADDFEPKEGETVPEDVYQKYDALCEECYQSILEK